MENSEKNFLKKEFSLYIHKTKLPVGDSTKWTIEFILDTDTDFSNWIKIKSYGSTRKEAFKNFRNKINSFKKLIHILERIK